MINLSVDGGKTVRYVCVPFYHWNPRERNIRLSLCQFLVWQIFLLYLFQITINNFDWFFSHGLEQFRENKSSGWWTGRKIKDKLGNVQVSFNNSKHSCSWKGRNIPAQLYYNIWYM